MHNHEGEKTKITKAIILLTDTNIAVGIEYTLVYT